MGRVVVKRLGDMLRHDAHVRVRCSHYRCQNQTIMRVAPLVALFHEKRWNPDLTIAAYRLRCSRCGRRGAQLEMVPACAAPHLDPPRPARRE